MGCGSTRLDEDPDIDEHHIAIEKIFDKNIKVDLSTLFVPDLSQFNSVYPPNLYPFVVSINVIVIPLLSHLL